MPPPPLAALRLLLCTTCATAAPCTTCATAAPAEVTADLQPSPSPKASSLLPSDDESDIIDESLPSQPQPSPVPNALASSSPVADRAAAAGADKLSGSAAFASMPPPTAPLSSTPALPLPPPPPPL
eukprot:6955244-Prymnesium_polylepis.1